MALIVKLKLLNRLQYVNFRTRSKLNSPAFKILLGQFQEPHTDQG